jgi:hypothetical protein
LLHALKIKNKILFLLCSIESFHISHAKWIGFSSVLRAWSDVCYYWIIWLWKNLSFGRHLQRYCFYLLFGSVMVTLYTLFYQPEHIIIFIMLHCFACIVNYLICRTSTCQPQGWPVLLLCIMCGY